MLTWTKNYLNIFDIWTDFKSWKGKRSQPSARCNLYDIDEHEVQEEDEKEDQADKEDEENIGRGWLGGLRCK